MEQQTINERLSLLVQRFDWGKKAAFARKAGISPQGAQELLAGRKGDPSFRVLTKVLESYPDVDANWLVLGQGPMLREQETTNSTTVVELLQLVQEYIQVSKQLEGSKAAYREAANVLNQSRAEVQHHETAIQVQTEHLPNFNQEAQEVMRTVMQQQQQSLTHARERYAALLLLQEQAGEELIKTLKRHSELEKKLGEFTGSAVPLTAEGHQ